MRGAYPGWTGDRRWRGRARTAAFAGLCTALLAAHSPAAAQHEHHAPPAGGAPVVLTGAAHDEEGAPLPGAVVQLFHGSGPGRHLLATTVTDAAGRFVLRAVGGTYTLEIRYPGHAPHRQPVTLATAALNLGPVRLPIRPLPLDPLTATLERAPVRLRSGTTVVEARASPAAGGSIADLLRTVPGVELDAEGRIVVRGSTSVLVLMNGRRIPLTGEALVAFLRQMPATALERVEVGTTASARQDAAGAAGVVNLVFRDAAEGGAGTRSLAGTMASADHYLGSAAASGALGGLLAWDGTYSLSAMRPRTSAWSARRIALPEIPPGDRAHRTDQESQARARHRLHTLMAGAAATPGPGVSLALRGAYTWMEGSYRNSTAFVDTDAAGSRMAYTVGSLVEHVIPAGELSAAASVHRGGVRITSEGRVGFVEEEFRGDHVEGASGYRFLATAMTSRQREHVLQNEVGFRVSGIDVEVGQKSQLRTLAADHEATHGGESMVQAFRYRSDVHGGFVAARGSAGGVTAEAGVRLEADRTDLELEGASTRTAVRLFPGLRGEWSDARRNRVYRLAYGRRIDRPGAEMLNPHAMGEDDMNEIIGNPSLLPELSDQVELGVERHGPRLTLQLTPFLRWTRDPIRPLKTVTRSGRWTTSLENLDRTRAAGADGSARARLTDGTAATLAGTVAHVRTAADTFGSSGVYTTMRLTVDLRVAGNTTAQLYAYRRSAQAIEQGEILPAFTGELALTQRLAGDRARLTLRLSDPLRSDRTEFRIADATFAQESRRRTERPLLSLFASYAVGAAPREDAPVRPEGPARIF